MPKTKQEKLYSQVSAFVKAGLLEFWLKSLPEDQRIVPLLRLELEQESKSYTNWEEQKKELLKIISRDRRKTALTQLFHNYKLSLGEFFVFALLGEVESSHLVNLALTELQLPDQNVRPSIHTINAIVEALFDETEATSNFILNFTNHSLFTDGWLELQGDGPLPLQKIKMHPAVWRSLNGNESNWSGCTFISDNTAKDLGKFNIAEAIKFSALFTQIPNKDSTDGEVKVLVLRGTPGCGRNAFAQVMAEQLKLLAIDIPTATWEKTQVLPSLCHYTRWLPVLRPYLGPGETFRLDNISQLTIVILGTDGSVDAENLMELRLALPSAKERTLLWKRLLDDKKIAHQLGTSVLLSGRSIHNIGVSAQRLAEKEKSNLEISHVYQARRHYGGEKLRLLAEPVLRQVDKNAIVLSASVEATLEHLLLRAKKREAICQGLGSTLEAAESIGVRALFVGESGTGKTLAASYVATQLGAPLYRVDLASVMNKYIGESEKNLSLLLDQAVANDVILLFDEADSLFGSRSEGKETGERYANMLTNFLLTRIENHPGVVILTTNSEERIDNAFNRRIDVVVNFPLPGFAERLSLWRSHLGERGPGEDIYRILASSSELVGGQVRNAVLAAATYANGKQITIENIVAGMQLEYDKLGRQVPGKIVHLASKGATSKLITGGNHVCKPVGANTAR